MATAISSPTTTSPGATSPSLRDWVVATNKGTQRFLRNWWTGSHHSNSSTTVHSSSSSSSVHSSESSPSPTVVAAICAPDSEERPVESAQQFCYTCYDSDEGSDEDDEALKLDLLKQLAVDERDPPHSGSSRAVYVMYSSQKSGSAA